MGNKVVSDQAIAKRLTKERADVVALFWYCQM